MDYKVVILIYYLGNYRVFLLECLILKNWFLVIFGLCFLVILGYFFLGILEGEKIFYNYWILNLFFFDFYFFKGN
jgi:hypothetical protein